MTGRSPWRSLHAVMIVTLHVAVVCTVVRVLARPQDGASALTLVPFAIVVAVFLSWPIASAFANVADDRDARRCPGCGGSGLRPLLKFRGGLFQPPTGYRCADCGTTFRPVAGSVVVEPPMASAGPEGADGVRFLTDTGPEDQAIRFLDETSG